jgi:hypothetical protein
MSKQKQMDMDLAYEAGVEDERARIRSGLLELPTSLIEGFDGMAWVTIQSGDALAVVDDLLPFSDSPCACDCDRGV